MAGLGMFNGEWKIRKDGYVESIKFTKMKYEYDSAIHCGNAEDSFEKLKSLCESEAEKICMEIAIGAEPVEIPFWTEDFPELICVGKFSKGEDGHVKYELDFTESTL